MSIIKQLSKNFFRFFFLTFVESKLQPANDNCMIQLYCHLVAAWHIVERLRPIRSPIPHPLGPSLSLSLLTGSLRWHLLAPLPVTFEYVMLLIWFRIADFFLCLILKAPFILKVLSGEGKTSSCSQVSDHASRWKLLCLSFGWWTWEKCPWRMIKLLWDLLESGETKTNPSNKYASPHWRLDCCGSSCLKHVAAWTETISCLTQSMTTEFLESKLDFW